MRNIDNEYLSPCPNLDSEYAYVKWHLLTYGNTNVVKNVKEIIRKLNEEGIEVEATYYGKTRSMQLYGGEYLRDDWVLKLKER